MIGTNRELSGLAYSAPHPEHASPERQIAQAVLFTACRDAQRRYAGRDARDFLRGGPMLTFWCAVAGCQPEMITRWANRCWPEAA